MRIVRPKIDVAAASDVGCVRTNNEDSWKYLEQGDDFWAAVADGCGGEAAGEVASRIAVEVFTDELINHKDSPRDLPFILRDAVIKANRSILEASQEEGRSGMGTTFSAIYLRAKNAVTVHAGDSRIYRLRDGRFEQLTEDHTWVQEQVKAGRMSPDQAETHPRSGILMKALGTPDFGSPDIDFLDTLPGDVFLLSTDGLHRVVSLEEIAEHMTMAPTDAVNKLIALALKRGSPDNVSVIVMRVSGYETRDAGTMRGLEPVH